MTASAGGGMRKRPEPLAVRKLPYKLESDRPDCAEWTRSRQTAGRTDCNENAQLAPSEDRSSRLRMEGWRRGTKILCEPQPKPLDSNQPSLDSDRPSHGRRLHSSGAIQNLTIYFGEAKPNRQRRSTDRRGLADVRRRGDRPGFDDFIVFVIDGESGAATQPDDAFCAVLLREPEAVYLFVLVLSLGLFYTNRRVFGGLAFHLGHRKILGVNPDFPAIQVLIMRFRNDLQNILKTRRSVLISIHLEIIVVGGEGGAALVLRVSSFPLPFQQLLEHVVDDELGTSLRDHCEFFLRGRLILHFYDHFCVTVGGKTVILDAINARALKLS